MSEANPVPAAERDVLTRLTRLRELLGAGRSVASGMGSAALDDAIAEIERLRNEVNCWRERGRGPMLHDPEMKPQIDALKKRMVEDPEFARRLGVDAGIWAKDGKITKKFGG